MRAVFALAGLLLLVPNSAMAQDEARWEAFVVQHDANDNGMIERKEFEPIVRALILERLEGSVKAIDADGDGFVSIDEAEKTWTSDPAQQRAEFEERDTDGDGKVEIASLIESMQGKLVDADFEAQWAAMTAAIIERADADDDGSLNAAEMAEADFSINVNFN